MINAFKHGKEKDEKIKIYRQAYIKEDNSGETVSFRYYLMDNETVQKSDSLRGIEMQSSEKIIGTYSEYAFTIKTKILIKDVQYTISRIYSEHQVIDNGLFRENVKQCKYLVIKR